MISRSAVSAIVASVLCGCLSYHENIVRVTEVDGSNDHRIFRIGPATKLMLEPALWQVEDAERVNFDRPVTLYFKDKLPPEFDRVTLRMLHDGTSGLPDLFLDPWCLGDAFDSFNGKLTGADRYAKFDARANFVRKLWAPRVRGLVRRGEPCPSDMAWALMLMAITDELGETPEQLLQRYVVRPYGLEDTSFELRADLAPRLTKPCAGSRPWLLPSGAEVPDYRYGDVKMATGGLLSSASDLLKVCYVVLPHLDRARGLLSERRLSDGRKLYWLAGSTYGGRTFVGFDPKLRHAGVVLENVTGPATDEGFELFESLTPKPRR